MPRPILTTLISLTVVLVCSLGTSTASAQSMSHPDSISPLKPNPYLRHDDPWRWDVRAQVFLRHGIITYANGEYREQLSSSWRLNNFEYIFPLVRQGGHYWSPNEEIETSFRIDDTIFQPEPKILQTPGSGAPYVWWKSNLQDYKVYQLHFTQTSHIVAADTIFNEELAKQIPWPQHWLPEAQGFLTPLIDPIGEPYIDVRGQDQLLRLVDKWLEGNDPKTIDQVTLAKFLTGKVIEHVRVTRGNSIFSPTVATPRFQESNPANGLSLTGNFSTYPQSSWSGFYVRSADQVALDPSGSVLDLSTMLTSVLRSVGIPARTVVCYNMYSYANSVDDIITAMVEFALYDQKNDQILWIPIDTKLLLDNGRRSTLYKQNWDYFGSHNLLRFYVPLAYYFHPPVNYSAYGFPALYGFKTMPKTKHDSVSQILAIEVVNSTLRSEDIYKNGNP